MAVLLYLLKVLFISSVCFVGIVEVITKRNKYASRKGIMNLLKQQSHGKVQVNERLSVAFHRQSIIVYMHDENGMEHEVQQVTQNKKESDFIYHPWRNPIIQKMKQIFKEGKNPQEQQYKRYLEKKAERKRQQKQYYQEFKEENRRKYQKYADCYKQLNK